MALIVRKEFFCLRLHRLGVHAFVSFNYCSLFFERLDYYFHIRITKTNYFCSLSARQLELGDKDYEMKASLTADTDLFCPLLLFDPRKLVNLCQLNFFHSLLVFRSGLENDNY